MVQPSERRISKYDAKLVGDVWKNRIDAQKSNMVSQFSSKANDIVAKEISTKGICETAGVSSIQVPFYMSYSRELWGLTLKHAGDILTNEAQLAKDKWAAVTRGLSGTILVAIAGDVYGITVT